MRIRYLSAADLARIAHVAVAGEALVRDYGLLEAAAARPRTTVGGADAYPSEFEKASALIHSIVTTHPLVDGNKRLGWLACYTFLALNTWPIDNAGQDDVFELVMSIADGSLSEVRQIARRLEKMATYDGEVPADTELSCEYCGLNARADEMAHTGYNWTDSPATAGIPFGTCRDCEVRYSE